MKDNFLLIKVLNKLRPFLEKRIRDYDQFIALLTLKLTIDDRKTSIHENSANAKKMGSMKQNLLVMAFIGFFLGLMMLSSLDLYYKVATLAGSNVFFLVMYMVSDFSSVLLDVKDSTLIMTRPVKSSTLNAVRIIHITYYMFSMFAAINLFSFVFGTARHGFMFILAMIIMMIFISFLIIFVTTILYSLLLKWFSGEKLKDILNVFQIIMSIVTVVAYQVLARMFEFVDLQLTINIRWWAFLLPPTWYAGLFKVMVEGDLAPAYVMMAFLGFMVPLVLGIWLIRSILPKYESYLIKLNVEEGLKVKKTGLVSKIKEKLMLLLSSNHVELAFMNFSMANMSRDRKLKLMIYPNHALAIVFPFIMLFSVFSREGIFAGLTSLQGSWYYLTLYFALMFLSTNFEFLKFSSDAKAAFIYESFPIPNKNLIYRAALKAYYLKFAFPSMLFLSILFALVFGSSVWLALVFINFAVPFVLLLKGFLSTLWYPFSKEIGTTGNKNFGEAIIMMLLIGAVALVHFFIFSYSDWLGLLGILVLMVAVKALSVGIALKKGTFDSH